MGFSSYIPRGLRRSMDLQGGIQHFWNYSLLQNLPAKFPKIYYELTLQILIPCFYKVSSRYDPNPKKDDPNP